MHFFYLQGHSQQPSAFNIDRRNLDSFLEPDVGMERGRSESGSAPVKNSGQNCEFHGQESLEEMHVTDRYEESLQNKENRGQICESDDQESMEEMAIYTDRQESLPSEENSVQDYETESEEFMGEMPVYTERNHECLPCEEGPEKDLGSALTNEQILSLLMSYVVKHNVSGVALQDLLMLFNLIIPNRLPKSKYFLHQRYFSNSNTKKEFYCVHCSTLLGERPQDRCHGCDQIFDEACSVKKGFYFFRASVGQQIKDMFENEDLEKHLINHNRQPVISDIADGELYKMHSDFVDGNGCNLTFTWNTDGVPVFKSSKFSIWPLFLTINEVKPDERKEYILLHSLWFGMQKPVMSTFLKPFVEDMNFLHTTGVTWTDRTGKEKTTRCFPLLASVDSVARAPLQGVKQFNGKFGCGFCLHPGVVVPKGNGAVRAYPLSMPIPVNRTREKIIQDAIKAHDTGEAVNGVKEPSPLLLLDKFDIIDGFVPDYMHCVLLGVVRQMVNLFFDSNNHTKPFYIGLALGAADECIQSMTPPSELHRSTRALSQRAHWKASEWRSFLLFYSPVLLETLLPKQYFIHWLLMHHAITLLMSRTITTDDLKTAGLCLYKFVYDFGELYGQENVSFNVHLLTHLTDSVRKQGPLWATSAFVFEDANQQILKLCHGTQAIEVQVVTRFLGFRKAMFEARKCLAMANETVLDVFKKLTNTHLPIQKALKVNTDFVGLGAPQNIVLSPLECVALDECVGERITARRGITYQRALCNNLLVTNCQYADKHRRNNSVVQIRGQYFIIYKIVLGTFICHCSYETCNCSSQVFILCHKLSPIPSKQYHDAYSGVQLHKTWIKVNKEKTLYAFEPAQINRKCLLLYNCKREQFVVKLLQFEID